MLSIYSLFHPNSVPVLPNSTMLRRLKMCMLLLKIYFAFSKNCPALTLAFKLILHDSFEIILSTVWGRDPTLVLAFCYVSQYEISNIYYFLTDLSPQFHRNQMIIKVRMHFQTFTSTALIYIVMWILHCIYCYSFILW
jgi:hypothetical protein